MHIPTNKVCLRLLLSDSNTWPFLLLPHLWLHIDLIWGCTFLPVIFWWCPNIHLTHLNISNMSPALFPTVFMLWTSSEMFFFCVWHYVNIQCYFIILFILLFYFIIVKILSDLISRFMISLEVHPTCVERHFTDLFIAGKTINNNWKWISFTSRGDINVSIQKAPQVTHYTCRDFIPQKEQMVEQGWG